jgi:transposase-like protein
MTRTPRLTEEQYAEKLGCQCPFCKSTNIFGKSSNFDAGTISQDIECDDCSATWQDVYTLTGYDNAKP